jgi:hypothetical protein
MLARGSRLTKEREFCCGLFLRNHSRSTDRWTIVALAGCGKTQFIYKTPMESFM